MLRNMVLILGAAASLAACSPTGEVASAGSTPANASASPLTPPTASSPLATTQIDDKVIRVSFLALDAAASSAELLLAAKIVTPGTATARSIANGLTTTAQWLRIASAAQQAGQAQSYAEAISQASIALDGLKAALSTVKVK